MADGDWWANGVIYQIYVRSFADSDGDGIGDIPGIISRLDYLEWLGVDAIWCSPLTRSSNHDFGYDVVDYCAIDPVLGTMDDFDRLIAEAGRRGIRVLMDLVPNHTSVEHPWFRDPATRRSYYVWRDRPNNWISTLHIPAWTWHDEESAYYLHSYLPEQPDLDWWNESVRQEFDDILRFWLDRGAAGFRIDACYIVVKDRQLRDNPPVGPRDHPWDINRGQKPVHSAHQPEVHDVIRRWRAVADAYTPPRVLMGATWVPEPAKLAEYYGKNDELHLPQFFQFLFSAFGAEAMKRSAESWIDVLGPGEVPVWTASNHDLSRFPSRWCEGDENGIRLALAMLLTLPGTCVLYQGDELGMEDVLVHDHQRQDRAVIPRDVSRTPIPWTDDGPHRGFTTGTPWLPVGEAGESVEAQRLRRRSVLAWTRQLIRLKKQLTGPYRALPSPEGVWRYGRADATVTLDFTTMRADVDG